jgi:hypothetical protein
MKALASAKGHEMAKRSRQNRKASPVRKTPDADLQGITAQQEYNTPNIQRKKGGTRTLIHSGDQDYRGNSFTFLPNTPPMWAKVSSLPRAAKGADTRTRGSMEQTVLAQNSMFPRNYLVFTSIS